MTDEWKTEVAQKILDHELEIAEQASLKMLLAGVLCLRERGGSAIAGFTVCGMTVAKMCVYLDHMGVLKKEDFMKDFDGLFKACLQDVENSGMRKQLDKIKAILDAE